MNMGAATSQQTELANVYIFNKISKNRKDVELLYETFQKLECTVTEVRNRSYHNLKKVVASIVEKDFAPFNYIVIIILDNTNEDESIWITTDGKPFHINGDLMTAISANPSLKNKLRFCIIQTNRVTKNDPLMRNVSYQKSHPGNDVKFYATSTGCALKHKWNSDLPSPFIKILCEEITQNLTSQRPIVDMLNVISDRVAEETIFLELPSKEMNFDGSYILGNVRN